MFLKRALLVAGVLVVSLLAQEKEKPEKLAPYYPSPPTVVEKMLVLGELKPGETHFDLGSGDGRIVIMAAQKFGAKSTGFEIDPKLIAESRSEIIKLGLHNLAKILEQDLMTADFGKADLITAYLLPGSNTKLIPVLEQKMHRGARLVSHDFAFRGWTPEKTIELDVDNDIDGLMHTLYLYRHP